MAVHKPLVLITGQAQRLPAGDTISGATAELTHALTNNNAGAITIGQVAYISAAGAVDLANANSSGTAKAIGLVQAASISPASSGPIQYGGILTSADWTAVTGSANLTPGADYFLASGTPGGLTTTPPDSAGEFVLRIGTAVSNTELSIEISRAIGA